MLQGRCFLGPLSGEIRQLHVSGFACFIVSEQGELFSWATDADTSAFRQRMGAPPFILRRAHLRAGMIKSMGRPLIWDFYRGVGDRPFAISRHSTACARAREHEPYYGQS